tara:strand:- start:1802 stop:2737 length:936 start_codon:yes stop_codon:yes gene_type:complete
MTKRTRTVCIEDIRIPSLPGVQLEDAAGLAHRGGSGGERDRQIYPIGQHPSLIVYGGPHDGAAIPILKRNLTMGSLPDNDIVVDGAGVARRHAEIFESRTGYFLRDLGVANPTFVNRHDIGGIEQLLNHGDRIQLADSTILHVFTYEISVSLDPTLPPIPGALPDVLSGLAGPPDAGNGFGYSTEIERMPDDRADRIESLARPVEAELYEGAVRLDVGIEGGIWRVANFVTELRGNTQLRVLRLLSNPPKNVESWLSLREPIPLEEMLGQMEEVSQVSVAPRHEADSPDQEQIIQVRLNWDLRRDRSPGGE